MKNKIYHILMSFSLALMLTTSYLVFTEDTHAISYLERQRCDYIFSEYAFTQVDRKDYPECSKRFDLCFTVSDSEKIYETEKEMMKDMYGKSIQDLIDKQQAKIDEWKDMEGKIKEKIEKIAKDMGEGMVLSALLTKAMGIEIANALSIKLQEKVRDYLKTI